MLLESISVESHVRTLALFRWDNDNRDASCGGGKLELASWLAEVFDHVSKPAEFWTALAAEVEAEAAKNPAAVAAAYAQEDADWAELSAIVDAQNAVDMVKEGGLADRLMAGEALPIEVVQHIAAFARTEADNAAAFNDGPGYYAEWLPVLRKAEAIIAAAA